jgi:hypothetical protein
VSRIVRAVSAEDVSGASGIDPLPDGRSGAGLYAIEQASRIWRNEHHLAILRAQERCSTAVSRKSPKAVPLAPACVRHIESALSPQLRRFTLPATRGQQTPPLSCSTFHPSHQEREKNAHDHHLRQPAHRKKIGTQSENRPARRWIDSGVIT